MIAEKLEEQRASYAEMKRGLFEAISKFEAETGLRVVSLQPEHGNIPAQKKKGGNLFQRRLVFIEVGIGL